MSFQKDDFVQFLGYKHIEPFVAQVEHCDENFVNVERFSIEDGRVIKRSSALTFTQNGKIFGYNEHGKLLINLTTAKWEWL